MTELKALLSTRDAYLLEEIAQALAQEREIEQKDMEIRVAMAEREREWSQFQSELALHQGYSMLLAGELWAAHIPVPVAP